MNDPDFVLWETLEGKAAALLSRYRALGLTITTAESCTGGLVAGVLTAIAGSSDVMERGFVTYTNAAKTELLGVAPGLFESHGAVSAQVAEAMARGALEHSPASVSISITGVAGPGGGSDAKPVGLVHFGSLRRDGGLVLREMRYGERGRRHVRLAAVSTALDLLAEQAEG